MAERVTNKLLLTELMALRNENRTEHTTITSGLSTCMREIGGLQQFRDNTQPRLNGMSKTVDEMKGHAAEGKALRKVLIGLLIASVGAMVGAVIKGVFF